MSKCYHCGEEIIGEPFHCNECGQDYCSLHKEPLNHECNIVKESLNIEQVQPSRPTYTEIPSNQQLYSDSSVVRGTTDGSFVWYRQESSIPENAFDPDSGIEFKGILLPHKSESLHLLIGATLIFLIGLMGFYSTTLITLGYGWAIFMLAGFYTTAFLFHEFGHRQVAKHFGFQTKFRLLTFGMILTAFSLLIGIVTLVLGSMPIPTLALPGAVVVLGLEKVDRKTGLCKAAGPIINLVYGAILLLASFIVPTYPLNIFIAYAAALNFMLGAFNMIPIGILDGRNIWQWNKILYLILFALLIGLLVVTYANILAPTETNIYVPKEWKSSAS